MGLTKSNTTSCAITEDQLVDSIKKRFNLPVTFKNDEYCVEGKGSNGYILKINIVDRKWDSGNWRTMGKFTMDQEGMESVLTQIQKEVDHVCIN